jgi:pimeloyl-ACP methyl ester carboxylesterase
MINLIFLCIALFPTVQLLTPAVQNVWFDDGRIETLASDVCLADARPASSLSVAKDAVENQTWHGFTMLDSTLNGINFKIVFPTTANQNRDWIWRARFWGHEPQTDIALLERGFHLVYIDVAGLFGSEKAISIWNDFYAYMRENYQLNPKVVLEGMSRGGLIVYNWANQNSEKVACIYADAPVCDFKSWPMGKWSNNGSPEDWQICLAAYEMTEEQALAFDGNPVDHLEHIAAAHIPILHIVGDADQVVPVSENTDLVQKRLESLGWQLQVIRKPDVGHHPHSLKDPTPIVDFILLNTGNL